MPEYCIFYAHAIANQLKGEINKASLQHCQSATEIHHSQQPNLRDWLILTVISKATFPYADSRIWWVTGQGGQQ